jgi:hypothetical protein
MAFVSTLGAPDQNSLLSVDEATSLLGDLPQSEGIVAWLGFSVETKQRTLIAASLIANSMKWKGRPLSSSQGLAWPRRIVVDCFVQQMDSGLPGDFRAAIAYLAAFLGEDGGYMALSTDDGGAERLGNADFEEVNLGSGALQIKYGDTSKQLSGITVIPPFSMDIFSRYMVSASFSQPRVVIESNARIVSGGGRRRLRQFNGQIHFTNY